MTFNDLEFKPHPVSKGGVQAKTMIGDYELSVVNLNSHGPLYEIAIFDGKEGPFVKLPGIHSSTDDGVDDVIHYLSPEKISGIMLKLSCIAGPVSV